ncbi:hypothetical protein CSB09_03095 [Candidatus Gracilibacteria bacterium]|nr:MAG: hypothetical protein CSB09_03095 [Candidatus Gracilibacteria bacterium]
MISYTRLTGIYILLFLFLAIYFHKFIFNILKKDKKSVILTLISSLSIISPFLFSLVFPYIDGNNNYFLGPQNYANHFAGFQDKLWERLSQKSMVYDFIPSEILHDFANNFQQGNIFIILGLIFIVGNSIYFLFSKKRKPLDTYVISILLFLIFFHGSAKFLNAEYFTSIIKYFPFITNNLDWLFIIYIPLLTYIFSYNLTHSKRKYIFTISLFIYIFISLFPLLNFPNNFKSQLVDINAMSEPYKKTFFTKNNDNPVSILYPQHTLHIKGNPYHIKISNNYNYILPFNKDSRLSGKKQSNLYDKANQYAYFPYYYLFNIKNIFVFKDIEEFDKKLDWYSGKNLKQKSEKKLQELYANDNLYIKQDNSSFTQFGFSYDGEYEYLLYAPNTILKKDINEMFSGTGKLDISQKIINIDTESFHKPQKIENFEIPEENRNLAIRYKKAYHQHTKIYAKFGNIDPKKPFIIQLNRTFGMSWKLKWISKKEFEEEKCIDAYKKFPVTQNVYCNYKPTIIDLADTKYLDYPKVKEENHFEGNFIGNTWLVEPDDIPENMKNNDVLYAVIIYEKQIWYNWFFVLSGGTFLLLILIALYQEVRSIFRKKKLLNK